MACHSKGKGFALFTTSNNTTIMCDHHTTPISKAQERFGSRLEHGEAHSEDHKAWSRRAFLSTMGLAGMGSVFMLGANPVKAFGHSPLLAPLGAVDTV